MEKQNSEKHIVEWVNTYSDELFNWAYYKTSKKETAEDLVQETFLSAFKNIANFRKKSNPKTWLFTILNNKIIDHYRSAAHKRMTNESSYIKDKDHALFNDKGGWMESSVTSWEKEPHLLDDPEFLQIFKRCIDRLPEKWKAVTLAKFFHHKKGDQICHEIDISPSNLWQIVHRSKLQLKDCLDKHWNNE